MVEKQNGTGLVGDVGLIIDFFDKKLSGSIVVQNLGIAPRLGAVSDDILPPTIYKVGVGLNFIPLTILVGEIRYFQETKMFGYVVGTELASNIGKFNYAIRSGYDSQQASFGGLSGWTFGGGFGGDFGFGEMEVNYCYIPYSVIGTAHKISIGYKYSFGKTE